MISPVDVFESRIIGRDHTGAGAAFNGHVADGHTTFHTQAVDRLAAVFKDITGAAADADFGDDRKNDIFRRHTVAEPPFDIDRHGLRFVLKQRLRRQHMPDFTGADAKSERAKGAMRAGMAVPANDSHARLRQALFRPNHMHDALARVAQGVHRYAEIATVPSEDIKLLRRQRIGHRDNAEFIARRGRRAVIHRAYRLAGAPNA